MPTPKQRQKGIADRIAENRADLIPLLLIGRDRVAERIRKRGGHSKYAAQAKIREDLYKEIRSLYATLEGDLRKWSEEAVDGELEASLSDATTDIAEAGVARSEALQVAKFSRKHLVEYVERVSPFTAATNKGFAVNGQLSKMAESDIRALRQAAVEVFREAAASGMSAAERQAELQRRVFAYADDPATWQFIDASGRKWQNGNYFNMVNRTISANVARDTYNDAILDVGGDLVEVIGGSSSHDQVCSAKPRGYVGRILSITGETEGYETVDDAKANGLWHPQCVHLTKAVFPETSKGQEKAEAAKKEPRFEKEKKGKPRKKTSTKNDKLANEVAAGA